MGERLPLHLWSEPVYKPSGSTALLPFYNPPGARGEDTFLSTMLRDRKVLKVPCYAFHDGFSYYQHLLDGALPIQLAHITANSPQVITRFVRGLRGLGAV